MSISKKIREEMSKLCGSVCEDDGRDPREFQTDEEGLLWMMIHSGSRAMGQLITEYHLRNAVKDIRRVMKAQRELVKIVRMVKPLISYKAF